MVKYSASSKGNCFCLSDLFDLPVVMASPPSKPTVGESSRGKSPAEYVPAKGEGIPPRWWDPKDLLMPLSAHQLRTFGDYCERHNERCPIKLEDPKALEVVKLMG